MSFTLPVGNFPRTQTVYRPTVSSNSYAGVNSIILNPAYAYDKSLSTFCEMDCYTSGSALLFLSTFEPFVTKNAVLTVNYSWSTLGGGIAFTKINYSTDGGLTTTTVNMTGTTQTFSLPDGVIGSQVLVSVNLSEKTATPGLATLVSLFDVNITQ